MRGLLLDVTPLRGREFRLLCLGQLVSFVGSMITFVALQFQMYELTGSTFAVGALGACEFVPISALPRGGGPGDPGRRPPVALRGDDPARP